MPKIAYQEKTFRDDIAAYIRKANEIVATYLAQGYRLTLRQLYYQFVARDILPNTERSYKNLGNWVNEARLAGLLDWNAIEDRTRNLKRNSHWDGPADIVRSAAQSYGIDLWEGQEYRVEVWVEKEALAGVIERPSRSLDVPWFCCRGYVSQSEMWRAAMRLIDYEQDGAKTVIIHLGDHDPSGIDMTRDIQDRLALFGADTRVLRIALNMDQVEHYGPPPNPAKLSDSRSNGYVEAFGFQSWELDALEPSVIDALVSETVEEYLDVAKYEDRKAVQEAGREKLLALAAQAEAEFEDE